MDNKKLHRISNELLQLIGGGATLDCKAEIGKSDTRGRYNGVSCEANFRTSKNGEFTISGGKDMHTGKFRVDTGYKLKFD